MELSQNDLDLIQKHAFGRLTPAEEALFSRRFSTEKNFRAEVDFQAQLFSSLQKREAERLKKMLQKEEADHYFDQKKEPKKPSQRVLWLVLAGLAATGLFFFFRPKNQTAAPPSSAPEQNQPLPKTEPPAEKNEPLEPKKDAPNVAEKIARAAENYAPNAALEALVKSQTRAASGDFVCENPKNDALFRAAENGSVAVRFSGSFADDDAGENGALTFSIFNNRDPKPIFSAAAPTQKMGERLVFDFVQNLPLGQGLFYFSFEKEGELVGAGRFLVE